MGCGASTPAPLAASSPPPVAKPYVHGEAKPQEPADKAPAPEKPNVLPSTTREGEVYEWLRDVGMCEYTDSFLAAGFDTLHKIATLDNDGLSRAGVAKMGHRKKLGKCCAALAKAQDERRKEEMENSVDMSLTLAPAPHGILLSADQFPMEGLEVARGDYRVRSYRGNYEANAPCEDCSVVSFGEDFLFVAVLDGHGGKHTAAYIESAIFGHFSKTTPGKTTEDAIRDTIIALDEQLLASSKARVKTRKQHAKTLFTGTCCCISHVDMKTGRLVVSNLGDSRAVLGRYPSPGQSGMTEVVRMSNDHCAKSEDERENLLRSHPHDPNIIVVRHMQTTSPAEPAEPTRPRSLSEVLSPVRRTEDGATLHDEDIEGESDWRVKGVTQFTRSIGDYQMKDKAVATLYNSRAKNKVMPRPGVRPKGKPDITKPYVSNVAEHKEQIVNDDAILVTGCDGVWDEITDDEAILIVHDLLLEYGNSPEIDLAGEFIKTVLRRAVARIATTMPEQAGIIFADPLQPTLEELLRVPAGKTESWHRSMIHDDITVVITLFGRFARRGDSVQDMVNDVHALTQSSPIKSPTAHNEDPIDLTEAYGALSPGSRKFAVSDNATELGLLSPGTRRIQLRRYISDDLNLDTMAEDEADSIAQQVLSVVDTCSGMNRKQMQLVFAACDTSRLNELTREDLAKLIGQVLHTGAPTHAAVVKMCWDQMTGDEDQEVEMEEEAVPTSGLNMFVTPDGELQPPTSPTPNRHKRSSVTFDQFSTFFNMDENENESGAAAAHKFQVLYDLVVDMPLLKALEGLTRQEMMQIVTTVTYTSGEAIITQGDPGDAMYIVDHGEAQAEIAGHAVRHYAQGQYFGELALQADQPRAATVRAGSCDCTCLRLDKTTFDAMILSKSPKKEEEGPRGEANSPTVTPKPGRRAVRLNREAFDELPGLTQSFDAFKSLDLNDSTPKARRGSREALDLLPEMPVEMAAELEASMSGDDDTAASDAT